MIDWTVLLLPLATLPVILIFGFVGCTLSRTGTKPDSAPGFIFPGGLHLKVVSLTVKMTLSINGSSQSDSRTASDVLGDFTPGGGRFDFSNLTIDGSGQIGAAFDVTCVCTIIVVGQGPTNVPVTPHPNLGDEQSGEGKWNDFLLVVTGTGFEPGDYSVQ
jgi:hypothetical protein